ncbi:2-amino-4-hydroxy-6-hydroxymethyldihydropteridine diphosphokinase [Thiolapillus brandeum]|uniref:2-amino-4-hydroxy-6-hydroxymethyldihydropteridine diphosphokinase n=1 Tax=Thiolapillus brandeum TaxID=1076588 RepID=A0A7U6GJU9_9GAMM|nr:2-amino-4-hydroxy-6-hydroxymethyldihydropteridine diphosphokinase [Thiolapillus brandeum]BAO44972.1 2-amino-4-hydroxy-6-hydroxymethyldihydropteridine pyrophosphokinase [Thiolapillus brandeum]
MTRAWISAGSNVEREHNIRQAIETLQQAFGVLVLSPIYRTRAEGFEGEDFLNLVIGVDTELSPGELRQRLREIEDRQGRVRGENKYASRTLDLDLLTWGDLVDQSQGIPRDEILKYAFVLKPLADVAPDQNYPGTHKTFGELWAEFPRRGNMQQVLL